jgi:surface-adhesin protein E
MRKALAIFALLLSGLWAATAHAAPSPMLNLAAWVSQNTDLAPSQVAIAGPENVYSLEPLGPRLPTGEVLALVRTEAVTPDWRAAHQFQSWDAHLLINCNDGRLRLLRSASYAERDRKGPAKQDELGEAWFSPQTSTPAATLVAAACDPAFSWPLRGISTAPSKATPDPAWSTIQLKTANLGPPAAPSNALTLARSAVQIAQAPPGQRPNEQGGALILVAANETAGPDTAPVEAQPVRVASADLAPLAPIATVEFAGPRLQKANFISEPSTPEMSSAPRALSGRRHAEAPATVEPAGPRLQKASFTSGPTKTEPASAPPQALGERPHASVFATVRAATRTCGRLVGAGPSWLWRRVEVAWAHIGNWQTAGRSTPSTGPPHAATAVS